MVRSYNHDDYEVLKEWWEGWKLPTTPESYLSDGVVVLKNNKLICAGFLYRLGETPMFWIEGIVSDPTSPSPERKEALKDLIAHLSDLATDKGCELLMGSTPREKLAWMFWEKGFNFAPEQYTHLAKRIK